MIALLLIVVGLLVSAFFSAVETALVSANRTRLSHRADEGDVGARRALELLEEPRRLFGATLVGNTLANVLLTTLATLWFEHRYGEWVVPWLVVALTVIVLVAGEIVPKAIARAQADDLTVRLAAPLDALHRLFQPLIGAVNAASTGLVRLLGVKAVPTPASLNRQDFQLLLDESEETGQVAPGQGRILSRVMDFGETSVREAMRPRTDIVAAESGATVRDVIHLIREKGFSRIPVYRDDLDQIVGIVHLFDLFRAPSRDLPVDGLLRPVDFVPEAKPCDELLREMRARRRAIAIVVDEYGGTAGLVTTEDLVEELVGDIRGEEEAMTAPIRPLDGQRWAVDGSVRIVDLNEALDVELPEGDYETVAGLFLERFGRVPQPGDALAVGNVRLEVLAADARRIGSLAVSVTRR
ncbi:MAG: hemolysin family protein [Candidatus Eisenbacteria bacterium]